MTPDSNDGEIAVKLKSGVDPQVIKQQLFAVGMDDHALVQTWDESQGDFFLRRARLELGGHLLAKALQYNITLNADKWDKLDNTNKVNLFYAYARWVADEACVFTLGKEKLPYSRVSLASSSKQLIIERPVSTEAAKKIFGATDAYYQPKLSVGGSLAEGVFGYEVAVADGWENNQMLEDVRLAVEGRCPVHFKGRMGGMIPSPDEVLAAIEEIVEHQHIAM